MWFRRVVDIAFAIAMVCGAIVIVAALVTALS